MTEDKDQGKALALKRHVHRCYKTITYLNDACQRDGPLYFRSTALTENILRAFDDLARLRQYRPPSSLRYAATLFVHLGPFLLVSDFT
jgi:hypothetical protein